MSAESAVAPPVIRHGAAAVGNDEAQRREVGEEVALDELHEGRRVGVDVVRAGGVKVRVATARDVDHRRHVELDHLLVDRVPVAIGERRPVPPAAAGVGVQVAADEAQFVHAALEFLDRSVEVRRRGTGGAGRRR